MSCRFPGSPDPDRFWEHLKDNKDLISEVPSDRWDWQELYGDPQVEKGKTKSKWGGFIDDIDKFDPLYSRFLHWRPNLWIPNNVLLWKLPIMLWKMQESLFEKIKGTNTGVYSWGCVRSDYSVMVC